MSPADFDALPVEDKEQMIATFSIENMLAAVANYVPETKGTKR